MSQCREDFGVAAPPQSSIHFAVDGPPAAAEDHLLVALRKTQLDDLTFRPEV
jgi:hypothetical protein